MHVRRTILCLVALFLWAAYDPDMASGQSSELSEQNAAMVRAIQEQVRSCWQPDPVAQSAEDIVVETRVLLNPDGSVKTVEILDVVRMIQDSYFRSAAENVKRAIMRCSPLRLPVEKYEVWKQLTLRFDPQRAKAKLPLEDQQMAKKKTLLSKEDAAAMFLFSKEQWNDNVLRAHRQGVARAVSSPSGTYKMGVAYPEGYHMVVTPAYHRGDEKPSYLQVYVIYPPALQKDFTEEIIEQVKETAVQEMRPQFSVTASHEITDLGLGFIFFIEDAR